MNRADEDEQCALYLRNRLEGRNPDPEAIRKLIMAGWQGYRIWSNSLDLGLVLADSHDRIRNLATDTAALWLLESGISVRRPEKIYMR